MNIHWNILGEKRGKILPLFAQLRSKDFYLAGGTGLALQVGHRDSVDFDFFTKNEINTGELFEDLTRIFKDHKILKVQDEKNTLSIIIDETIKISFISYDYDLLRETVNTPYFAIASIVDIGCMKCAAITSRSAMKDYIDLYFILQSISLREMLALCSIKYPSIDTGLILKSLIYFKDLGVEPIIYKENHDTDFEEIKRFLKNQVSGFF